MSRKKILIIPVIAAILITGFGLYVYRSVASVPEMFKLNGELQAQGYYMAEFEYKMLGIAYYLDKGHYFKSLSLINQLHKQLETKEGLIKIPKFASKEEELEFYLNLQNPKTGAFIDDAYPLVSFHGPTENVLLHLETLAKETGKPLHLKYPLKYLDEINTPAKLTATLNDWSTVGRIASKFPQTSFHSARDILSLARDNINYNEDEVDLLIQKYNLYSFSPEWRIAMLKWFYDNQDPETGLWGPKSKDGKLLKKDINNASSILQAFVDENGNNIHKSFPIRYQNQLFASVLAELSKPLPGNDKLDEWHDWNLKTPKGLRMLTRYLWKNAAQENKEKARELIEKYIKIEFERFYVPEEGSFSYYPNSRHATLDGIGGGFFIFEEIGALSNKKQTELWGSPEENIIDLGVHKRSKLTENDFKLISGSTDVNSFRFYGKTPEYTDLTSNVSAVVYPKKKSVLDILDLTTKIKHWLNTTPQTMGNWVSKESVRKRLEEIRIGEAPVYEDIPLEYSNKILHKNRELIVIGFDVLQIPRYKMTLLLN